MKGPAAVLLIISVLSQLNAQCSGQYLGNGPMGTALAHAGGGSGSGSYSDAAALGMTGNYGPNYGPTYGPPMGSYGLGSALGGNGLTSGIGSLGGCCGRAPGAFAPISYGPQPTITHSPIIDPVVHYPANIYPPARIGPQYLLPTAPPPSVIGPGMPPAYGLGAAQSGMTYIPGPTVVGPGIGGGSSGTLLPGSASTLGYGPPLPPSIISGPQAMPVMSPSMQMTENENANTNININHEMGQHHSLLPKGLMGLVRM